MYPFLDWLLALSDMLLSSSLSLHGLLAHSFVLLNNISLYGCTIFCLSIHLLKDIFVVSRYWQFHNYQYICGLLCRYKFCVDVSFQFIWVNSKEGDF